jgi:hypothetical protein
MLAGGVAAGAGATGGAEAGAGGCRAGGGGAEAWGGLSAGAGRAGSGTWALAGVATKKGAPTVQTVASAKPRTERPIPPQHRQSRCVVKPGVV